MQRWGVFYYCTSSHLHENRLFVEISRFFVEIDGDGVMARWLQSAGLDRTYSQ
jgi:hypothetical protein